MRAPALATAASLVLIAEGIALAVIALIELFGLGAGDAANTVTAVALIVLTLIGAAALVVFGLGTRTGRGWARSGGVLAQVLGLALVAATLTSPPVAWTFVVAVGVPAVVGLVLLLASARREGREAPGAGAEAEGD